MAEPQFIERIEGLGDLFATYSPFDEQIEELSEQERRSMMSVRDISYARLHGKQPRSKCYTVTCHASICAKDSPTIVARISPGIEEPEMLISMVQAHKNLHYPAVDRDRHIYKKWRKIAEEDEGLKPEERRAIILPEREDYLAHRTSSEAKFFFQDTREKYFNEQINAYLKTKNYIRIQQLPVTEIDSQKGTIMNCITFDWPGYDFCFSLAYKLSHIDTLVLRLLREGRSEVA